MSTPWDPIAAALAEDVGPGDVTCQFFVAPDQVAAARIIAKEPAVVAGVETAAEVFSRVDPTLRVQTVLESGTRVIPGDTVLEIHGAAASILSPSHISGHA